MVCLTAVHCLKGLLASSTGFEACLMHKRERIDAENRHHCTVSAALSSELQSTISHHKQWSPLQAA